MKKLWILKVCSLFLLSSLFVFGNAPARQGGILRLLMDLWPVVPGTACWFLNERRLGDPSRPVQRAVHALAVLTILWMLLWMMLWLSSLGRLGEAAIPLIQRLGWVNLLGFGAGLTGYLAAFREEDPHLRTAWFWLPTGWCMAYVSWVSMMLEPARSFFRGPAFGGILLILIALYLRWMLQRKPPTVAPSL